MRSNLASREDASLVPGEVMYRINPSYFRVERDPPKIQDEERLYYQPCAAALEIKTPESAAMTTPRPSSLSDYPL